MIQQKTGIGIWRFFLGEGFSAFLGPTKKRLFSFRFGDCLPRLSLFLSYSTFIFILFFSIVRVYQVSHPHHLGWMIRGKRRRRKGRLALLCFVLLHTRYIHPIPSTLRYLGRDTYQLHRLHLY
ncbi:hypothetical protein F4778DRAFT_724488 [Xylariomycetidae sp. FL2044]|nr:hypothetical protein F4778DRAFT_724488 [Xylariomycetidae sp. FL2044]